MYSNMGFFQNVYGQGNNTFIPKGLLNLPMYQKPAMPSVESLNNSAPAQFQMPPLPSIMQPQQDMQSGGLLGSARETVRAGAQQAATSGLAAMGVPPQLANIIAGKIGGSKQPDMPLQIQEMTPMQFQQPQQMANGSTQFVKILQGLLG